MAPLLLLDGNYQNGAFEWKNSGTPVSVTRTEKLEYPVCVKPPFFFVLAENINEDNGTSDTLNCAVSNCSLAACWDASSHKMALIVRIPPYLPYPVEIQGDYPVVLHRNRRDFGITAAIIIAVAAAVTGAAVAGIAFTQSAAIAATVDTLSERVSTALSTQQAIDNNLAAGILTINQQVALLQEQVDILYQVQSIHCAPSFSHICVTSAKVQNLSSALLKLNQWVAGPWNVTFLNLTTQLVHDILAINQTRVPPITGTQFLQVFGSFIKAWSGSIALGIFFVIAVCLGVFALCRLRKTQKRHGMATYYLLKDMENERPSRHILLNMLSK